MLKITQLSLSLDGLKILSDLSFDITEGKITGLIGPNGAGKSTIFHTISGLIPSAKGSIIFRGQNLLGDESWQISRMGITRTFQDSQVLPQITVMENLLTFTPLLRDVSLAQVFLHPRLITQMKAEAQEKALQLLKKVGMEHKAQSLAEDLSYGQKKIIEILKVMMSGAELILLDEPFAGLYPEIITVITRLIRELAAQGKTIIFVEHNMRLIQEICDQVIVLDYGQKIAEGTFAEIRKNPSVIEAYLGR